MLKSLYIRNYIIIDEISLDFYDGMSVFTGKTGAGKSIIVDALSLLCGERVSASVLKDPQKKALIEAVFTADSEAIRNRLMEAGFEDEDEFILTREFSTDMKSNMRLNHRNVTLSFVRDVMRDVVDIHNQHDTQYLLENRNHLLLLDRYINDDTLKKRTAACYEIYRQKENALNEATSQQFTLEERDYLLYQKEEIEKLQLYEGEVEELQSREKEMLNFEKSNSVLSSSVSSLEEAEELLYSAIKTLSDIENEKTDPVCQKINDFYYELLDQSEFLKDYQASLYFDENELNRIQERLFAIRKIQRKYGESYSEIMSSLKDINDRLEILEHREEVLNRLSKEKEKAYAEYVRAARQLSSLRKDKARTLEGEIRLQLRDLQLENTRFQVSFEEKSPSLDGSDKVAFMVALNSSSSLQPLANVASGGEQSRIMLGLKTIFNRLQGIETVIFDEIDTGVSGTIATSIGLKMHEISENAQVLSLTHLSQVAACADHHYRVEKSDDDISTMTSVKELRREEIISELAEISTGIVSERSLLSAEELYESSRKKVKHVAG